MLIFLNDINALHKRDPYVFRIKRACRLVFLPLSLNAEHSLINCPL